MGREQVEDGMTAGGSELGDWSPEGGGVGRMGREHGG